jgi:hypothetical protein
MLKVDVLRPMPRPIISTDIPTNSGDLNSCRNACFTAISTAYYRFTRMFNAAFRQSLGKCMVSNGYSCPLCRSNPGLTETPQCVTCVTHEDDHNSGTSQSHRSMGAAGCSGRSKCHGERAINRENSAGTTVAGETVFCHAPLHTRISCAP